MLQADEYVSNTESIYSIISFQNHSEIEEMDSDSDNNKFIDNILESTRKYKDKQIDDIEKLDQIESMLTYLGQWKIVTTGGQQIAEIMINHLDIVGNIQS